MKIIVTHLVISLLAIVLGYSLTTIESSGTAAKKDNWSLSTPRLFTTDNSNLNRLSSSSRWEVNLEAEERNMAKPGTFDVSRMKLVGVILGESTSALIEVANNVKRFKIGEVVMQDTQARLVAIDEEQIRFSDGSSEYSLFLYPGLKND